jgi:hypothetical protein
MQLLKGKLTLFDLVLFLVRSDQDTGLGTADDNVSERTLTDRQSRGLRGSLDNITDGTSTCKYFKQVFLSVFYPSANICCKQLYVGDVEVHSPVPVAMSAPLSVIQTFVDSLPSTDLIVTLHK